MSGFSDEHGPRTGDTFILLHGNGAGGWMWEPQIERMPARHVLTPDLPGLGGRREELWPGLRAAADDIAATVRERAIGGRAHVVGLSLGGFVALQLLRRHPDLVRSCFFTGVAASGLSAVERGLVAIQRPLWSKRWYWAAQAVAFGIPRDGREVFIDSAAGVRPETNRRIVDEIVAGAMPPGPFGYEGPLLVAAGRHEPRSVRDAFPAVRAALPQARTWVVPGMHHIWNIEQPDLFTEAILANAGVVPDPA